MSEKGKGVLAYIFTWIGGLIVLYGMKDNERNTKIHAAQAIVIGIGYMVIYMIYRFIPVYIPFFSTYSIIFICIVYKKTSKGAKSFRRYLIQINYLISKPEYLSSGISAIYVLPVLIVISVPVES